MTEKLDGLIGAISTVAKMLSDSMISSGMVPKEREAECIMASSHAVAANPELAKALVGYDETARAHALLQLMAEVKTSLGINEEDHVPNKEYSSTVYADTHEELMAKKRKVDIYASIGILTIFGFLGSFVYAIYLFFVESGNPILWAAIGVALFMLQKWIGKKHDELTG